MLLSGDVHFSEVNCYNATSTGKYIRIRCWMFTIYNFYNEFSLNFSWSWWRKSFL